MMYFDVHLIISLAIVEMLFRRVSKEVKFCLLIGTKNTSIYYGAYVDILINEENKQANISEWLANHLKRLADNSRLKILFLLKDKSMCGQEIKKELNLSNATISHHMSELIGASFVLARKEGNKTYYSLNRIVIKNILDEMQGLLVDDTK